MQHTNHFETVKECDIRLRGTVVLYDGHPYYVLGIADHKNDGIYRIYLDDVMHKKGVAFRRIPMPLNDYPVGDPTAGIKMDEWLDKNPDEGVIRKMMNSPSFKKFRPFPLGMVNDKGSVVYTQRAPTRATSQGLTQQMVHCSAVSVIPNEARGMGLSGRSVSFDSHVFGHMLLNNYPSFAESIQGLSDPRIGNTAVAFHREFALARGPLGMMFLAYKADVVGVLPDSDSSCVILGSDFHYCREVVENLSIFDKVRTKK